MSLIDLLFPKNCLNCGTSGKYLCTRCIKKVKLIKQVCIECEKPAIDGMTHVKCKRKRSLDGAVSVWLYEGIVRKAITKLKYRFAYEIASELAKITACHLKQNFTALPKDVILTPIPLHILRKNWRGFNQSEKIGELLAANMGWRFVPNILIRTKQTKPQTNLSEKARKNNLLGVFSLNPNCQLQATNYIIFDDVTTTGTTLKEAAKVFKRGKVKKIWGLTVAR